VTIWFEPAGELRTRLIRTYDHLESDRWRPESENSAGLGVFKPADYAWPGDNEGRTLLAWTLLERATGRRAAHAETLVTRLDEFTNGDGYFGPLVSAASIDEQQLSGQGWLLRALCERWESTGDGRSLDRLRRIAEALAGATRGAHRDYPIRAADRIHGSGVIGEPSQILGRWKVSSDIGCVFIFLDGLAHAASILDRPQLDEVVEEIISRFLEMRIVDIQAQTHATLTGVRALLRWHARTGRRELLGHAEEIFDTYLAEAMSENHENWNWFGRPTHTETCAVVDSFMVAVQLWQRTGRADRLADAHRIYINGLGHAQRGAGGFGCDSVLGSGADPTFIAIEHEEAWWCCTMRGAEGLTVARDLAVLEDGDSLTFPFFFSGRFRSAEGTREWTITSEYPREGRVRLRLDRGNGGVTRVAFYRPPWATDAAVTHNGRHLEAADDAGFLSVTAELAADDILEYSFEMPITWTKVGNVHSDATLVKLSRGPVLFGLAGGGHPDRLDDPEWDAARSVIRVGGRDFTPLDDMLTRTEYSGYRRQVLFRTRRE
jgi:hypothetical protein